MANINRPKALPIRSHNTQTYKGRQRLRDKLARSRLEASVPNKNDPEVKISARQALEHIVETERNRGQKDRWRWQKLASSGKERLVQRGVAVVDPLAKLQLDTRLAGERYMKSLTYSGIVDPYSPNSKRQKPVMNNLHKSYVHMMVLSAMNPLRQGISASSVVQTMGMTAAMLVLSKDFRAYTSEHRNNMLSAIKSRIGKRLTKEGRDAMAMDKLAKAETKGKDKYSLARRWQKRLDRIERGNRDPFTVESAAMTEVALMESAYAAMRDPRVPAGERAKHIAEVEESLNTAMTQLNQYIVDDGLDRESVSKAARVVVGRRLEREPELASVFVETGHGRFVKTPPAASIDKTTGEPVMAWTGDFVDAVTDRVVARGSFSLRHPGNYGDHLVLCSTTLEGELEDADSIESLNKIFADYTAASLMRKFPNLANDVEDPDVALRMQRAGAMFASMEADGITQAEQRNLYASAFVDAMSHVGEKKPELMSQWEAHYGTEWRENLQTAVQQYSDMGERFEREHLTSVLVNRGYTASEAFAAVAAHQEEDHMGPAEEYAAEQARKNQPHKIETYTPDPLGWKFVPVNVPVNYSRQDKVLLTLDEMSNHIGLDLWKAGEEVGGTGHVADDPSSGIIKAIGVWGQPTESIAAGKVLMKQAVDGKIDANRFGPIQKAQYMMAQMDFELEVLGVSKNTRDSVFAAALARGISKVGSCETSLMPVFEMIYGPDDPFGQAYINTIERTARYKDWRIKYDKIKAENNPEKRAEFKKLDPRGEGYSSWMRQFNKIDNIRVKTYGEADRMARDAVLRNVDALTSDAAMAEEGSRKQNRKAMLETRLDGKLKPIDGSTYVRERPEHEVDIEVEMGLG